MFFIYFHPQVKRIMVHDCYVQANHGPNSDQGSKSYAYLLWRPEEHYWPRPGKLFTNPKHIQ